jgi:hypothetical protein
LSGNGTDCGVVLVFVTTDGPLVPFVLEQADSDISAAAAAHVIINFFIIFFPPAATYNVIKARAMG